MEWVPGVPRLEMGFGGAQDGIRVGDRDAPRPVSVNTHVEHTLRERLARRDQDELHGTIVDHRGELSFIVRSRRSATASRGSGSRTSAVRST